MTEQPPNIDLYTRNGFAGPMATLVRAQYAPTYTRVSGTYTPRRFSLLDLSDEHFADEGALPAEILVGDGVSIEYQRRRSGMPYALRNVWRDELHYIYSGSARLESDFGVLDVGPGDFVLLPRAVTYRYVEVVGELSATIVSTDGELGVDPENAPGVLNVDLHVDQPRPYEDPVGKPGEHQIVLRHGQDVTTYYYEFDPLPTMQVMGAPIVRRFNISNVHGIGVTAGGLMPSRLINDQTTRTLIFYVGTRQSDRPPIHHNADYDEIICYVRGPGQYGALKEPGTMTWTPKGVVHQGPDENVPEGFQAFLIETRAHMRLTEAGAEISALMETAMFDVHPTEREKTTV